MTSVCNGEGICWEERESPTLRHQVAGTVVLNERHGEREWNTSTLSLSFLTTLSLSFLTADGMLPHIPATLPSPPPRSVPLKRPWTVPLKA